jgi:hypothetical protein
MVITLVDSTVDPLEQCVGTIIVYCIIFGLLWLVLGGIASVNIFIKCFVIVIPLFVLWKLEAYDQTIDNNGNVSFVTGMLTATALAFILFKA